jgi:hypothetical protein
MTANTSHPQVFNAFVLAIPENDDLLCWVRRNCPGSMSEAELFRFLCCVGQQFMDQSMDRLHTDAQGVLEFVRHPEFLVAH